MRHLVLLALVALLGSCYVQRVGGPWNLSAETRLALVAKEEAIVRFLSEQSEMQEEAAARAANVHKAGKLSSQELYAIRSSLIETRIRLAEAKFRLQVAREMAARRVYTGYSPHPPEDGNEFFIRRPFASGR